MPTKSSAVCDDAAQPAHKLKPVEIELTGVAANGSDGGASNQSGRSIAMTSESQCPLKSQESSQADRIKNM